jgi:ankyrin repeat protein
VPSSRIKPRLRSSQSVPGGGRQSARAGAGGPRPESSVRVGRKQESQSDWKESHDQLFQAIGNGDYSTVEYLLSVKKISVNQMDSHYQTPLMIACEQNSGPLTRLCLEYGARIDEFPEPLPTALHSAATSRSFECMSILIQATTRATATDTEQRRRLETLINRRDSEGNTAIHLSSYFGDANILELLLCNGADMTLEDRYGRNTLHLSSLYGSKRSLMILLDQGGDCYLDYTDSKGYTPLHYCAEGGYVDCVELLLGAAADPSLCTLEGFTPYALASHQSHTEVCHLLSQYTDGDPSSEEESPNGDGFTLGSSLRENDAIGGREEKADDDDEETNTDTRPTHILTAAHALRLAMSHGNDGRVPSDEEEEEKTQQMREYQLYLINNGMFPTDPDPAGDEETEELEDPSEGWEDHGAAVGGNEVSTAPLEEFQYGDCQWRLYLTEDGYPYYLNSDTNHSQWEDPRAEGIIVDQTEIGATEAGAGATAGAAPRTPNPKATPVTNGISPSPKKLTPAASEKKFTRPRLRSPLRISQQQDISPPNTLSSNGSSPRPIMVIDRTHHHSNAAKTAWMQESVTPTASPSKQPQTPPSQVAATAADERVNHPRYNAFSPDRPSAERAKSLRRNAPFPLSSPPQSLRIAAMKARHETETKNSSELWASPSRKFPSSGTRFSPSGVSSPQPNQSPHRRSRVRSEVERSPGGSMDTKPRQEDLSKSKSFEFRDGSYGCGGNRYTEDDDEEEA